MSCVSSCQLVCRWRSIRHTRDYRNQVLISARLEDQDSQRRCDPGRVSLDRSGANPLGPRCTPGGERGGAGLCLLGTICDASGKDPQNEKPKTRKYLTKRLLTNIEFS